MSQTFLRFFEAVPAALAVGLLLLPLLSGEDGAGFKRVIAFCGALRAVLGFGLILLIARAIIPADVPLSFDGLVTFCMGTSVGRAWLLTQLVALLFAAATLARLRVNSHLLDKGALGLGALVLALTSVTGHAIDDSFSWWQQASFLLHTVAGLTWLGGLIGLVWWMFTGRDKSPEVAAKLADRWSLVAKIAIVIVVISGIVMAWENVGSFANLLATAYGRLLTIKLALFCASMLAALALALYLNRRPVGEFDFDWYGRVGLAEAVAATGLVFIAGWIAVITPASHETDLYWPLPFRLSWSATWGYVGAKLPWIDVPNWYLAPSWSGLLAVLFLALAALFWLLPRLRPWRRFATPAAATCAVLFTGSSFATLAYTDTYNDPAVDYTAMSVVRGQKNFNANCASCHGASGEGNGELAAGLKDAKGLAVAPADLTAPHVGNHTIGDIFHWLTFGGTSGVMPGFKDALDADDRWDVINFLLMMSYSNRARFIGAQPMVQWLIAPDFQLVDPEDKITTFYGLRGTPTLLSFARCNAPGVEESALEASLAIARETSKAAGANHVTVYQGGCPASLAARTPSNAQAVERAYSIINRYPNEKPSDEIQEAHYLIDRSGYLRSRYRHFEAGEGQAAQLSAAIAQLAKEPFIFVSLHSH